MDTIAIVGKIEQILPLELKGANKDFKVQSMILTVDKSYKKDGTPAYFVSVEVWKIAHYIEDTNAVQNLNPFPTTDAPLKQGTDDLPF